MNAETQLLYNLNSLNYSIDARPLQNSSLPITVWMALRLFKVIDFSSEERLSVMATLITSWKDAFLVWDPAKYGGIQIIYRRADMMWRCTPFTLWNTASSMAYYVLNSSHPLVLQYDGSVAMDISSVYTVVCAMDVTYFPWDTQQCQVQIKPTVLDILHMVIAPVQGVNLMASADPSNTEWTVQAVSHYVNNVSTLSGLFFSTNTSAGYKIMSVYYYNITLSRNPVYYAYNIIAPVCIITGLSLMSFFLPGAAGERIGLTVSVFLSFSVFQSYVNNFMPRSVTIPLLTMYIVSQMAMSAFCVLSGIISLILSDMKRSMPAWLEYVVSILARALLVHIPDTKIHKQYNHNHASHVNGDNYNYNNNAAAIVVKDFGSSFDANGTQAATLDEPASFNTFDSIDPGGEFKRNTVMTATPNGLIVSDGKTTSMSGPNKKWAVLNEVFNRIVLLICLFAIVFLTLYFLLTIELNGKSSQ